MDEKKRKAQSVRAKLLNKARKEERPFMELLQLYAMEKYLLRISKSDYTDDFVLKGALMLRTAGIGDLRPTRDIDFSKQQADDAETLTHIFKECCEIAVEEDGLFFDPETMKSEEIRENQSYRGIRLTFRATLGSARIPMQIDIGFGDTITPNPLLIEFPSILGDEQPKLQAYTFETAVAEKYEAMVQLDMANSRMKDFYDIWYISNHIQLDPENLQNAIRQTFLRRGTELPLEKPAALTDEFYEDQSKQMQWKAFIKKLHDGDCPKDLREVIIYLEQLLWPVTQSITDQQ
jgi:predicted nucleotidyltransferase component of viral defense system